MPSLRATSTSRHARYISAFATALVAFAILFVGLRGVRAGLAGGEAFVAFYCAGEAANLGADPYRVEPLRSCEHRVAGELWFGPRHVEPAPLPGYDLLIFRALAVLPFGAAAYVFLGLLLVALAFAAVALAALADVPLWVGIALCAIPGYQNVVFGELTPIVLAALAGTALALSYGRWRLAACCSAVVAIEPHVGAAVFASLFVWVPRARARLALAGVVLLAAGAAATGPGGWLEYVRDVLPVHARSEIGANDQFSLTVFAHLAGAGDDVALMLGSVSYAVMFVLGVVLAGRLAWDQQAWIALVPAAAVVVGGVFIHDIQIGLAMPAALFGAIRFRSMPLWIATAVSATWWNVNAYTSRVGIAAALVICVVGFEASRSGRLSRRLALGTGVVLLGLLWFVHQGPALGGTVTRPLEPMPSGPRVADLASTDWGNLYRERDRRFEPFGNLVGRVVVEVSLLGAIVALAFARPAPRRDDPLTPAGG